jgi:hypothetical protein
MPSNPASKRPGTLGAAAPGPPELSKKDFLLLLLGIGLVTCAMLAALLFVVPHLPPEIRDRFYYILLIGAGLVSALVLRGYAHVVVHKPGTRIELGGQAAVFFLVVFLGFYLLPRSTPFNVVIRPHAEGVPKITSGKIQLEYGTVPAENDLDARGDAEFREIPREYWGRQAKILPEVDGYKQDRQTVTLDKTLIEIALVREIPETKVQGKIVPPQPGKQVKVFVEGEEASAVPDADGRFELVVHRKSTDRARFSVIVNGAQRYDDYQPLGAPVTLALRK